MQNQQKLQDRISLVLLIGTLLSAVFVVIGGAWYLSLNGSATLDASFFTTPSVQSAGEIWELAFSFTPLGIIELGLLLLVATQTARVALLCWFYAIIRDYKFLTFSTFILIVLIYSSFWRS